MTMRIAAIREGLNGSDGGRESGIEMIVRLADGDLARLPALATDLVSYRVDAILAAGPPAVRAARDATATIPVIAVRINPVAAAGIILTLVGLTVTLLFERVIDESERPLPLVHRPLEDDDAI